MKRNHEIRIKLSAEEHEKLKKKAEEVGMSISSLMRYLAIYSQIKVRLEV